MRYIDGFVVPVPKKNLKAYCAMSKKAGKLWRKHGALVYRECEVEDSNMPVGITFPKAIKLKAGETVVFAYIEYKSRAHRDKVNKAVMSDPAMGTMMNGKPMPFDCSRMIWGGFKGIVEA
jgi:uncharacterized protein YbaA (DUF1428 family)